MTWKLVYTKQARKDAKKLVASNLKNKAEKILDILKEDPFKKNPKFEKLVGDLGGAYSRMINIQHRIVHQIFEKKKTIKIIRMWTHYE